MGGSAVILHVTSTELGGLRPDLCLISTPDMHERIDRREKSANRFHAYSKFAVCFLVANRLRLCP
jgi:hypothetical protein